MRQSFYLAFQYLWFHKFRSVLLVFALSVIFFLPAGLKKLISSSEMRMLQRADETPLIVGADASSTDLVISTLYFQPKAIPSIHYGLRTKLDSSAFGAAMPILVKYRAGGFPIVGTSLEYFQFRNLKIASGRQLSILGECVVGAAVAEAMNLEPGDSLISSSDNFFDIAGSYPLKMHVVGVLDANDSPDDDAIFTDVKTVWVIMGLGHGHQDITNGSQSGAILKSDQGNVEANASLRMYQEVTAANLASFHFHGQIGDYPLTAVIFSPKDKKSSTLLRGRFGQGDYPGQILIPKLVVADLLDSIFRIKNIFDSFYFFIEGAALAILSLVVGLTIRLRKDEIRTMFFIGVSRIKMIEIVGFEVVLLFAFSGIIGLMFYFATRFFTQDFIHFIIRS